MVNNIAQLLQSDRKPIRRVRTQVGTVVERRDGFYLRYYIDRNDERVKVTEPLCKLGTKKMVIEIERRRRMHEINLAQHNDEPVAVDQTISQFFEQVYLPWAKSELAASTVRGYEKLWKTLAPMVGARSLRKTRRVEMSDLLTSLVMRGWGRRAVQHAQYLLQGMFSRAVARELIDSNPMKGAKSDKRPAEPKDKIAYTDAEVVAVLNALERTDAKLLWSLCGCMGLRPSEASGLKWEDINYDNRADVVVVRLQICRAAPYGIPREDTKSELGERSLLLIEPVKSLLADWKRESGDPATGWVFARSGDRPIDHSAFAAKHIRPAARKAIGERYCGLYSGRHATGTQLTATTGNASASHQALGNTYRTSVDNYVHPVSEAGDAGLRLRESQLLAAIEKAKK
jgi:integrase